MYACILIYVSLILGILYYMFVSPQISVSMIEGFAPGQVQSYDECIASGFSKEFCSQTPTGALGPGSCVCPDGSIGYTLPGFRGQCVCSGVASPQMMPNQNIGVSSAVNASLSPTITTPPTSVLDTISNAGILGLDNEDSVGENLIWNRY